MLWGDTVYCFPPWRRKWNKQNQESFIARQLIYTVQLAESSFWIYKVVLVGGTGTEQKRGERWSQWWSKHSSRQRDRRVKCCCLEFELPSECPAQTTKMSDVPVHGSPFCLQHWISQDLEPRCLLMGEFNSSRTLFWVQLRCSGFSVSILPWAYFFGWGQTRQCRHFPLLSGFSAAEGQSIPATGSPAVKLWALWWPEAAPARGHAVFGSVR